MVLPLADGLSGGQKVFSLRPGTQCGATLHDGSSEQSWNDTKVQTRIADVLPESALEKRVSASLAERLLFRDRAYECVLLNKEYHRKSADDDNWVMLWELQEEWSALLHCISLVNAYRGR